MTYKYKLTMNIKTQILSSNDERVACPNISQEQPNVILSSIAESKEISLSDYDSEKDIEISGGKNRKVSQKNNAEVLVIQGGHYVN